VPPPPLLPLIAAPLALNVAPRWLCEEEEEEEELVDGGFVVAVDEIAGTGPGTGPKGPPPPPAPEPL